MTKNVGRLVYQRMATSLNVPAMSLHFKESEALTMDILLLIDLMCSWGSLLPSKDAKSGGLKFFWNLIAPYCFKQRLEIQKIFFHILFQPESAKVYKRSPELTHFASAEIPQVTVTRLCLAGGSLLLGDDPDIQLL